MKSFNYHETKVIREIYESDRLENLAGRVFRPFSGVRISEDHGESWHLFALCDLCVKTIDVPVRVKREGGAGAFNCDWCGAINELYRSEVERFRSSK